MIRVSEKMSPRRCIYQSVFSECSRPHPAGVQAPSLFFWTIRWSVRYPRLLHKKVRSSVVYTLQYSVSVHDLTLRVYKHPRYFFGLAYNQSDTWVNWNKDPDSCLC